MSLTLALALSVSSAASGAMLPPPVEMRYRSFRNWKFELPTDPFQPLQGGIPLAHANGDSFAVQVKGAGLMVDTTGDGTLDREIEPIEDPVTKELSARVVLKSTDKAGEAFTYAVRLSNKGKGWQWASGGAMVGKLGNTKVHLFDLNGNGSYNEIGKDAMAVGSSQAATLLSRTMHLNGELVTLEVDANGNTLQTAAFAGETGVFDVASKLDCEGKLLHAMVRSADGEHYFDLASVAKAKVPAGYYKIIEGELGLGKSSVQIDARKMKSVKVPSGGEAALVWGGPVRVEFDYKREGNEVTFDPSQVWYFGAAGERYLGWDPIGKSPEFTIVEKKLGTEIEKALFPGSC